MRIEWLKAPEQALLLSEDTPAPVIHRIGAGTATIYSARSPDRQTDNEDAAALIPLDTSTAVLCVADGVGGVRGGDRASAAALRAIHTTMSAPRDLEVPMRTVVLNGIEAANEAVITLANGSATTLALVAITGKTVRPCHVGDSVALVIGQRGAIKMQTISHSPVGFAVESGMLDETEAMHHEERHLVSNVVGSPDMRIELGSEIELAPYDTLVLASDGLLDNLHLEEIAELVRKGPLQRAAERLAAAAGKRMRDPEEGAPSKPDDLTFILYRPKPPKRRRRPAEPAPQRTDR